MTETQRAFLALIEFGFTLPQAQALADAGFSVWFIPAESVGM